MEEIELPKGMLKKKKKKALALKSEQKVKQKNFISMLLQVFLDGLDESEANDFQITKQGFKICIGRI